MENRNEGFSALAAGSSELFIRGQEKIRNWSDAGSAECVELESPLGNRQLGWSPQHAKLLVAFVLPTLANDLQMCRSMWPDCAGVAP